MLNIYWIKATPAWPVCSAGAVVIAATPEEATAMVPTLYSPEEPKLIGVSQHTIPMIVVCNDGEY